MNTVLALNNIATSIIPSNLTKSSQLINIDKSSFFNKMISIYENSNKNNINVSLEGISQLNLMDIITGNLADINGALEADEKISIGEADDEKKLVYDTTIDNFMVMMNYFNILNEETKVTFEKLPQESALTFTDKLPVNFLGNYELENSLHMSKEVNVSELLTKENTLQVNVEKLVDEINEIKDKRNINGNFETELLTLKEPLVNVNVDNKIVTITDESSKIKSQVLSQIKDKIVFMVEEDTVSGNRIKQVKMELQPHNLGKVDIKMTFEGNKISVEIQALNKETQKILSSNIGELTNILGKTTESSINVVVKNYESQYENHISDYNQNNGQRFKEDYDQQNEHSRQRNYYYNHDNKKDTDEDSLFSEIINLSSLKIK